MERECVDCYRPVGIEEDPTDGRCPECDSKHITRAASKTVKRGESETETPA